MASISKIRYTNVIYENGNKRYNDELFKCAGHNTAILLENGGGKTVFIQAALQAILPHTELGERKAKETFCLEGEAAHIAIEWIISEKPRRYGLTAVTLFLQNNELKSYKYVYEYGLDDKDNIERLPFTQVELEGTIRASSKGELRDYYTRMAREQMNAKLFDTTKAFHEYIGENFKIIADEWRSIALINGEEGGVDAFFDGCKSTSDLVEKLLLPTVEQGLAGKGSEEFADTFESQREHFKKHKQLEKSIEESQKIKTEIESYVKSYSIYDQKVKAYEVQKQSVKALWDYVYQKQMQIEETLKTLRQEEESIEQEKQQLEERRTLIGVSEAKEKWEAARAIYEKEDTLYQNEKRVQEDKMQRRQLLKLSDYKHQIEMSEAKIKVYTQQLESLERDEDISRIQEEFEENASFIRGAYENQLELLKNQLKTYQLQLDTLIEDEQKETKKQDECKKVLEELKEETYKLEGQIKANTQHMDKIKKAILSKSEYEDVVEQNNIWQQRIASIEEHEVQLKNTLRMHEQRQEALKDETSKKYEQYTGYAEQMSCLNTQITKLEEEAEKVLLEVKTAIPSLYSLTSIYAKPLQVMDTLREQVEKYEREKENALLIERQHARFIESYEHSTYFTADPLLEAWAEKWYSEFSFIQTGTAFITSLQDEAQKNEAMKQPKWSQLIIVADQQESLLASKIASLSDKLLQPVGILTLTKAKQAVEEGLKDEHMVYPSLWEKLLSPEQFTKHKKEAVSALEQAVRIRKEKENQVRMMQETLKAISNFLKAYPHETYTKWREENEHLKGQQAQLEAGLETLKREENTLEKSMRSIQDTLRQESEEKQVLSGYVEKASDYIKLQRDNESSHKMQKVYHKQMQVEEDKLDKMNKQLINLREARETIKKGIDQNSLDTSKILEDVLYLEVKSSAIKYCEESISYLKQKHYELKDQLAHKQKGRQQLEDALAEALKKLKSDEKNYKQTSEEMDLKDEVPPYKEAFDKEISDLNQSLKQLKTSVQELEQKVSQAKTEFDKKEQDYQSKKIAFENIYHPIEAYIEDCEEARKDIAKDKKRLKDKADYLMGQQKEAQKVSDRLQESQHDMELKDQLYAFCKPSVQATVLEEEVLKELDYHMKEVTNKFLKQLEDMSSEQEEAYKKIKERKDRFNQFCEKDIKDTRLRNMATSGVMQKENYEELIKWQSSMVERITRTLTILEKDLMEKDKIISQFIIHLYTYLKTVRTELEEIPKRTRVKTLEGWKNIYEFDIPSWQEDEGKAKMRNYIYSLLDEMDRDSFKDEQGEEDNQSIRKYVKEQFKLKQLLRIVMGNDTIKVKCRKVSSISSISSQKYSWETSTKWSGGEKWSKNMALYLGILNYLAQRKQNIYGDTQQVNRVVILDNPFGKASSGHVLEPVFFIAQQIGFQIIALTAHTEGDFIRKYFPIVYSCKLRATLDHKTNIFTKEQELKKAYFIDNDPIALSVLGETSQMTLF